MLKCSKCGYSNSDASKFCENCGNSLSDIATNKKKNILFYIVLGIISFYLLVFIGNFIYVQQNIKPLIIQAGCFGVNYTDTISYNQPERTIYIEIASDMKIKKWQVDAIGNKHVKYILWVGQNKLDYDKMHLVVGENFKVLYKIPNTSLSDFINFKKQYQMSEAGIFDNDDISDILNPDVNIRQKAKENYYAELERQRQQQYYRRSLLYNLYNPYLYY